MSKVDFPTALVGLDRAYTGIGDLTASLSRQDLLGFSRCHGWVVADVLFHLLCDAQRALVALATQGHVLAIPDFLATLATEAVIHHLDMTINLTAATGPDPQAVALATRTLDGLLGADASRPGFWTTKEYLLKGTGRAPLTARDGDALGAAAERFPLLS
jgi:hypothetical protein